MKNVVFEKLRRFRDCEDGTGIIPVALWAPFMIMIAVSTVDLGGYTMRQVSLERALDQSIRQVKLDTGRAWTHDTLKQDICDRSTLLGNCYELLTLEMLSVDMRDYAAPDSRASCTDTVKLLRDRNSSGEPIPLSERITPAQTFENGNAHQTMILRACYKYKTAVPGSLLASAKLADENGFTAVVSTGIFVHEPI